MFASSRLLLLPKSKNLITLVPKPRTRKPARRHAASSTHATCGASEVTRWSSPNTTPGADGHETGAGGSLPRVGPSAGSRPAGPPELAWPGGHPCRSPIRRPRPTDEDGSTDLFEKTAEACGWARTQWPVRLSCC